MVKEHFSKFLGMNDNSASENIDMVPVSQISMNPFQPREEFDPEAIDSLSRSIKEHGVLQPVILRPKDNGYELVAGERRLRASKKLGLKKIPGIIKGLSDEEIAQIALIENLQRKDLSFLEEAKGYKQLIEEFNLTQKEMAERIGKSQSTVANKMRILNLPDKVREAIKGMSITERHARSLLRLEDQEFQLSLVQRISREDLTVRETEKIIENYLTKDEKKEEPQKQKFIKAFKDIRLFRNAILSTLSDIREAGLDPEVEESEEKDYIEIRIKLPKKLRE